MVTDFVILENVESTIGFEAECPGCRGSTLSWRGDEGLISCDGIKS
jgi:hypothetical protein